MPSSFMCPAAIFLREHRADNFFEARCVVVCHDVNLLPAELRAEERLPRRGRTGEPDKARRYDDFHPGAARRSAGACLSHADRGADVANRGAHGRVRVIAPGDVLMDQGDPAVSFFVVRAGELETVRFLASAETLVSVTGPGQFTGEVNLLVGRPALFRVRVSAAGEAIELDRKSLLALVQTDAELGEIVMRAFISRTGRTGAGSYRRRRTAGIAAFEGHAAHRGIPDPQRLSAQLSRPRSGSQRAAVSGRVPRRCRRNPVVICRGQAALRNPSNREIAECLGFNESIDPTQIRDLVIVGAGPAGLASAVYGASEGLDVLSWRRARPAARPARARASRTISAFRPASRDRSSRRARTRKPKNLARRCSSHEHALRCDREPYLVETSEGASVPARAS